MFSFLQFSFMTVLGFLSHHCVLIFRHGLSLYSPGCSQSAHVCSQAVFESSCLTFQSVGFFFFHDFYLSFQRTFGAREKVRRPICKNKNKAFPLMSWDLSVLLYFLSFFFPFLIFWRQDLCYVALDRGLPDLPSSDSSSTEIKVMGYLPYPTSFLF